MIGKMSTFGGISDTGMANDSGLALYEAKEADLRPDLFYPAPADTPTQETWKRLKTQAFYIAFRYDQKEIRQDLQWATWRLMNPRTKQMVAAFCVDWGPGATTGRLVDVSPGIASALRLETDDLISVERL